jgi:hypothetical protein
MADSIVGSAPGMVQGCQIQSVPRVSEGTVTLRHLSLWGRVRLVLRRWLPAWAIRLRKTVLAHPRPAALATGSAAVPATAPSSSLEAGALVRVRSREEIAATLDRFDELKGCGFIPEMGAYYGTTQRVLKPVRRFVDERDSRVKKARGLYLLEGVMCEGTRIYGPCDRGCLYFWREEWLEPIAGSASSTSDSGGRA